ncbi:MAG: single-stranded DNA-binding protein [Hormoscilla sp.]
MNSCVLMAEIIQEPQLRYTADNQTPIAEMLVEFPGLRSEDPTGRLKVIGWGNLAKEITEHYHEGDRVVLQGRLSMNTIERPEGFKEKRAELTVSKIYSLSAAAVGASRPRIERTSTSVASNVVSMKERSADRNRTNSGYEAGTMNKTVSTTGYQPSVSQTDSNTAEPPQDEEIYTSPTVDESQEDEIPF